jgi:hypothetical protein
MLQQRSRQREAHGYTGSVRRIARERHRPAVLLDHALHEPEAEAEAGAPGLGGEERIEGARQNLRAERLTAVGDLQHRVAGLAGQGSRAALRRPSDCLGSGPPTPSYWITSSQMGSASTFSARSLPSPRIRP